MCIFYGNIQPQCPAWHYLPRNSCYAEKIKLPFIQQKNIYISDNLVDIPMKVFAYLINIKIIIIQFYFLSFILLYFLNDKLK